MNCTFLVPSGEPCGRTVVAEYFDTDELRGWVLVASLCQRHDNPAARRYALAKGIERRSVTDSDEPSGATATGERAQTLVAAGTAGGSSVPVAITASPAI